MPDQAIRFSLFSLLVSVGVVAVGVAALVNCTPLWLSSMATLSLGGLLVAISVALHGSGSRRAFALGCITWGLVYLGAIYFVLERENSGMGKLATTYLLKTVYAEVAQPVETPPTPHMPGSFFGPNGTFYSPDHDTFMQIGQLLWAWLFAVCGGVAGRLIYLRSRVKSNPAA
jgi:hypothetical protein